MVCSCFVCPAVVFRAGKECGAWCECWNCHNTPVEAEDDEVGGADADSETESDSENDSSESESESESEDSCGEMEL